MNAVVCAIAKLENPYILEWAQYHLDLGFSRIYIYDNNDIDGERISDVFIGTQIEPMVTVIDVRGKVCQQLVVYNECYYSNDFDWCAFIDIDEFITLSPNSCYSSISEFLSSFDKETTIHLNWMCYGDNNENKRRDGKVVDRFTQPILPLDFVGSLLQGIPENFHVKSIIPRGLPINWLDNHYPSANPHTPAHLTVIRNANGEIVDNSPWKPYHYDVAYIRHYITMSIEEYIRKIDRRTADTNSTARYTIARFFRYNSISLRKSIFVIERFGVASLLSVIIERFKWQCISSHSPIAFLFSSYRKMMLKSR